MFNTKSYFIKNIKTSKEDNMDSKSCKTRAFSLEN